MRTRFLATLSIVSLFFLPGCNEENASSSQEIIKDTAAQQTFFPVTDYIRGQLTELDSMPVTPLKIISANGKTDSVWTKKEDIRGFAEPFLHPEIDTSNFKGLFREKSFLDQTIDAFTFSYDPAEKLPDTLQLRRWDVYIDPKKNTIKRIYIVKETRENGITKTLQLTWKSGEWCKITTIAEQESKQPQVTEVTMKWDFRE